MFDGSLILAIFAAHLACFAKASPVDFRCDPQPFGLIRHFISTAAEVSNPLLEYIDPLVPSTLPERQAWVKNNCPTQAHAGSLHQARSPRAVTIRPNQPAAEVQLSALRASVWIDTSQAVASSEPITPFGNLKGNFGRVMFRFAEATPSAGSLHVDRRDRRAFQIGWWHQIDLTEKESGVETPP